MTKNRNPKEKEKNNGNKFDGPKSADMKNKKRKNLQRMGGGSGLSLEAFANLKSTSNHYNPALIKKRREFYKNAKHVSQYKKSLKQQAQQNVFPSAISSLQDENKDEDSSKINRNNKKKKDSYSLRELYETTRDEKEKERMEKEAVIQAKKEAREKAEAQRKATREKMLKKTRHGQPVMKYRIEHLLQSIQGSTSKSAAETT